MRATIPPGSAAMTERDFLVDGQIAKIKASIEIGTVIIERRKPPRIPHDSGPVHNACAGIGISMVANKIAPIIRTQVFWRDFFLAMFFCISLQHLILLSFFGFSIFVEEVGSLCTHAVLETVRICTPGITRGKKTFLDKVNFTPGVYGIVYRLLLVRRPLLLQDG